MKLRLSKTRKRAMVNRILKSMRSPQLLKSQIASKMEVLQLMKDKRKEQRARTSKRSRSLERQTMRQLLPTHRTSRKMWNHQTRCGQLTQMKALLNQASQPSRKSNQTVASPPMTTRVRLQLQRQRFSTRLTTQWLMTRRHRAETLKQSLAHRSMKYDRIPRQQILLSLQRNQPKTLTIDE